MVSKTRLQRINDRMREELSEIILKEVSDPRLVGVSITDVKVDRELAYAEIYFSSLEGSKRAEEIKAGFEHAQGFLRHALTERVDLRTSPRLRFHWDPTFEHAERIEQLFAKIRAEASGNEPGGSEAKAGPEDANSHVK